MLTSATMPPVEFKIERVVVEALKRSMVTVVPPVSWMVASARTRLLAALIVKFPAVFERVPAVPERERVTAAPESAPSVIVPSV